VGTNVVSNQHEILVEGFDDASLVGDVETAVRDAFRQMALPGAWRVIVRPSCVSGRWDVTVYRLDVPHVVSRSLYPPTCQDLVSRRLRESLSDARCA
jgi:hypothetical protein